MRSRGLRRILPPFRPANRLSTWKRAPTRSWNRPYRRCGSRANRREAATKSSKSRIWIPTTSTSRACNWWKSSWRTCRRRHHPHRAPHRRHPLHRPLPIAKPAPAPPRTPAPRPRPRPHPRTREHARPSPHRRRRFEGLPQRHRHQGQQRHQRHPHRASTGRSAGPAPARTAASAGRSSRRAASRRWLHGVHIAAGRVGPRLRRTLGAIPAIPERIGILARRRRRGK